MSYSVTILARVVGAVITNHTSQFTRAAQNSFAGESSTSKEEDPENSKADPDDSKKMYV
jgi:hypothetical protein